jgi:probable poly-beta-1,6-N-acetyl-D-glucosamine export protein
MGRESRLFKSLFLTQLLSSFLVFSGHYTALVLQYDSAFWVTALNQLSRYGTVLLAMISGFFTAHTFETKQPTARQYFSGKLLYIVVPFLCAGVVYHYLLFAEWPHTKEAFVHILLGKTGDQLYFLFMLCQYYVFAYLFRNIITKQNITVLIWLFMALQFVYIHYLHHGWLGLTTRHFFPAWIFTFYLGHLLYWYRHETMQFLRKHRGLLLACTLLSVVSTVLFVLSDTIYVAVHLRFVLVAFVSLIVLLMVLERWADSIPVRFRKGLTLFIYLSHSAVMICCNLALIKLTGDLSWIFANIWFTLLYLLVIYAGTVFLSWGLARIMHTVESMTRKMRQLSG